MKREINAPVQKATVR